MGDNKKQETSEIDTNFMKMIQEIEKDYTKEYEIYMRKKNSITQEAINVFQEKILSKCGKEKDELSNYMRIENEKGVQVGKVIEGKENEFRESYQKFFECSLPYNILYENYIKNLEISTYFPVK